MGLIEVKGVRKSFGGLVAVEDVDLVIESGEIRGLIGPNGSGKTTMLNLMSGWLRPNRGSIVWKGHDVTGLPPYRLARQGLARTFQLPTLFRELTALQNVMMGFHALARWNMVGDVLGLQSHRSSAQLAEDKANALLELLGIQNSRNEPAGKLPLGYQRWLGIAVALSISPSLLMLDEPLAGMNPVEKSSTMDKIKMLSRSDITVLLVEHDMRAVMSTCDKITVMNAGRKIAEGSPRIVRNDPLVVDAYLGKDEL